MLTCKEIRAKNLRSLIDAKFDGSLPSFAKFVGKAESQIRRVFYKSKNSRCLGDAQVREIEKKCNLETGWIDNPNWESAEISLNTLNEVEAGLVSSFRQLQKNDKNKIILQTEKLAGKENKNNTQKTEAS